MKDAVESLGRIRLQGFALLLVAFLAGGFAGGALERVLSSRRGPPGVPRPPQAGRLFRPGALPPFFDQLDLAPEQREQITRIVERRRPETDSVMAQVLPRLRALTDSTRAEIHTVLTPEQREKLERLMVRGFRGGRRPGGGPFPGGSPPPGVR